MYFTSTGALMGLANSNFHDSAPDWFEHSHSPVLSHANSAVVSISRSGNQIQNLFAKVAFFKCYLCDKNWN